MALLNISSFRASINPKLRGISSLISLPFFRGLCSGEITQPASASAQDFLLQNIKSSANAEQVLQIVGAHNSIMNSRHVMQALKCLFHLEKSGNFQMKKHKIANSPEFITLCKRLKSQARSISVNDTVEALKVISFIGIPSNTTVIQVLLQLIRQSVNELSLHHIVFIDFIMKSFDRSPLVDALRIALPLVFEAQLSLKMNRDDVNHLTELLQYACKKSLSETSVNLIVEALRTLIDDIDLKSARHIVWSLGDLKKSIVVPQELLVHCWNTLAHDIEHCSFTEIDGLLRLMVKKYLHKQMVFYHENFADQSARYVISKDCGFQEGIQILRNLTRLDHVNPSLIDYLAEKVVNKPELIEDSTLSTLLTLVSGIANADYKPLSWNSIKEAIVRNKSLIEKEKREFPWVKLALELAALDIFVEDLVEYVFQDDFLQPFFAKEYHLIDHLQVLLLYQTVLTLYPSYSGTLPQQSLIDTVMARNGDHVQHFPLQGALERGLGGDSYVWTQLHTRLGHFVDHLVVMRKGGYPVALNRTVATSSKIYVEDLLIPSDSQIILVLCMPATYYATNCKRMRSIPTLMIRTLEASGYSVVPVSLQLWMSLPDYEKIPYLMHNIKLKCESFCNNEVSVVH